MYIIYNIYIYTYISLSPCLWALYTLYRLHFLLPNLHMHESQHAPFVMLLDISILQNAPFVI